MSPSSSYYYDEPLLPNVYVLENFGKDTGLLDKDGNRYVRLPNPIGFGRDSEWNKYD